MIHVTDHALVRYCERVLRIDIDAIRRELSAPAMQKAAQIGCDTVILGNGARVKLVGHSVQTVLAKDMRDHHDRFHGALRVAEVR